jgi:RNA polymerase I-specific transcription initiation factor RRN7
MEMRLKLPGHFHSALEIRAPLGGAALHRTVLEQVEFYNLHFEMVFPQLNYPLLLFKHMRDLGVPGQFLILILSIGTDNSQLKSTQLFGT